MDAVRITRLLGARLLGPLVATVAVLLGGLPASALAAPPKIGGLVPLTGAGACATATSTTGCATDPRLGNAAHVALSTSGNAVYVTGDGPGTTNGIVLAFARDPRTGRIGGAISCWAFINPGGCNTEGDLYRANYVAAGPNGLGLYVSASDGGLNNALVPLRTDPTSGAITGVMGDCFYQPASACSGAPSQVGNGMSSLRGVTVAPDGSVYTVAHDGFGSTKAKGGIAAFFRNPASGALTVETNCLASSPSSQFGDPGCTNYQTGDDVLTDAQDVTANGKQLYAIVDNSNPNLGGVISYSVDPFSGKLLGRTACFAADPLGPTGAPCDHSFSIGGGSTTPVALAAAPDTSAVYVVSDQASSNAGTLTTFGLQTDGSLLSSTACLSVPFQSGCATASGPLAQPMGVAVSPDSANIYVASPTNGTHGYVTAFARNPQNGAALPLAVDCVSDPGATGNCATTPGLAGAASIAVSSDGRFVYVVTQSGGLVALAREVGPTCQAVGAGTRAGVPVSVPLTCSDSDGEPVTGSVLSGPAHGSVHGTGPFLYTPNPGFTGTDTFTFNSSDGTNPSGAATATITASPNTVPPGQINATSRIVGLPASVRSSRLTSISGTAGPAGGVQSVSVGILRLANGAHAARARPACLYLGSNGKLKRTAVGKRHTCAATHLLRASGTLHWVLRLRHHLPRGTYIVYSQAVGTNGKRETIRVRGGANVARVKVR